MIPLTRPLVDFADVVDDFRRIVESGTHDELIALAGRYATLWQSWSAH